MENFNEWLKRMAKKSSGCPPEERMTEEEAIVCGEKFDLFWPGIDNPKQKELAILIWIAAWKAATIANRRTFIKMVKEVIEGKESHENS